MFGPKPPKSTLNLSARFHPHLVRFPPLRSRLWGRAQIAFVFHTPLVIIVLEYCVSIYFLSSIQFDLHRSMLPPCYKPPGKLSSFLPQVSEGASAPPPQFFGKMFHFQTPPVEPYFYRTTSPLGWGRSGQLSPASSPVLRHLCALKDGCSLCCCSMQIFKFSGLRVILIFIFQVRSRFFTPKHYTCRPFYRSEVLPRRYPNLSTPTPGVRHLRACLQLPRPPTRRLTRRATHSLH